jgi:HAD superfamily hydrolase (TIGR01484 family)
MAHKLYKLLVIDIDGTLINKEGVLSEKDTEAIKKAIQTGIRVVISTGRVAQASDWVLKALSLDGYHIFSDGALVANPDSGEEVYVAHGYTRTLPVPHHNLYIYKLETLPVFPCSKDSH